MVGYVSGTMKILGRVSKCCLPGKVTGQVPLCPNLAGSLEAPTTAKLGALKKFFAAASMLYVRFWNGRLSKMLMILSRKAIELVVKLL